MRSVNRPLARDLGRSDILLRSNRAPRTHSAENVTSERNQARDAERLPEEAAPRLLERASELGAARVAELSVADLRETTREAGITPGAFEQAQLYDAGTREPPGYDHR